MRSWSSAEILAIREQEPRCLALDAVFSKEALVAKVCEVTKQRSCLEVKKVAEGTVLIAMIALDHLNYLCGSNQEASTE